MTEIETFEQSKSGVQLSAILCFLVCFCPLKLAFANAVLVTEESQVDSHSAVTLAQAEISSSEVTPGSIVMIRVKNPENLTVTGAFEGIQIPFYSGEGYSEAVLGVPYERKPGPGVVKVKIGSNYSEVKLTVLESNYSSEILHVDGRRVNPTRKKDLLRIRHEQQEVKEIYKKVTPLKFWKGPFLLPIKSPVTSPFGIRRLYNGKLKNFHPGMDLKAPVGTPVMSAAPGVIVLAKSLFYTGNTVMIDHGYGIITLYAHMNRITVNLGETVGPSQLLGYSGKTGRVNGPHLHWQAVVHHTKINPLDLTTVIR